MSSALQKVAMGCDYKKNLFFCSVNPFTRSLATQHGAYLCLTHFKTILKWGNPSQDSPLCRSASGRSACPPSPAGAACPRHSPRARCASSWGSGRSWTSWESWRQTCRWCWRTAPPQPPACTPAAPVRPDSAIHQRLQLMSCHYLDIYTLLNYSNNFEEESKGNFEPRRTLLEILSDL